MSVVETNKNIVFTDCLTGRIICKVPYSLISSETLENLINDIVHEHLDNGFMVKLDFNIY